MTVPAPAVLAGLTLGEAAVAWAAAGWSVFPVVPRGKTPYGQGEFCRRTDDHSCGFHCATAETSAIEAWWASHPESNIGLSSPDAFIVDEDRLGALLEAHIRLPRCPYATTGRAGGGRHFFLRAPAGWAGLAGDAVKVTPRLPSVEVKGFGKGYVVAAPSVHASGARYQLELGGHMPEVGDDIVRKLVEVERIGAPGSFIRVGGSGYEVPERVSEGGRYQAIRGYVAHLYNRGFSIDEMWAQVRSALAPKFSPRLSDRELSDRFRRVTEDLEKNLGPRRATPTSPVAAPAPLVLDDAPLTEYDSTPISWLWEGWLPRGAVTVMDGNPGVSKSTLVADLVARMTTGRPWPDGRPGGEPTRAMWITTEDDPGRVLRPRIEAAGGDVARVLFVRSEVVFPAAAAAFQELLVRRASEPLGLGLVVLDPLFSHIEASVRTIADAEMRRGVMNPLTDAADAASVAVLVVRHFSKDVTASAINRGAGSLGGIIGKARSQWTVTNDPDDDTGATKAVGVSKSNYAREPRAWRYVVGDRLPPGWATGSVPVIEWIGEAPTTITAVLAETPSSRDAQPVLLSLLRGGAMAAEQIFAQMKARGYGRDATRSAKARLGVLTSKSGMTGGWVWGLPGSGESGSAEESEESAADSSKSRADSSAPRAAARTRSGPEPDSSDPSKSRKGRAPAGFPRAAAGAREAGPVLTVVADNPGATVDCRYFTDHQTRHRRTASGWICDICSPEEAS